MVGFSCNRRFGKWLCLDRPGLGDGRWRRLFPTGAGFTILRCCGILLLCARIALRQAAYAGLAPWAKHDLTRASSWGGVNGLARKSVAPSSKLSRALPSSPCAVRTMTGNATARLSARMTAQHFETVDVGHVEIEHDEIRALAGDHFQSFDAIRRLRLPRWPPRTSALPGEQAQIFVVVHDQDQQGARCDRYPEPGV